MEAKKIIDSGQMGKLLWMRGAYGKAGVSIMIKIGEIIKSTLGRNLDRSRNSHVRLDALFFR